MKIYKKIGKYPLIAIILIGAVMFIIGPILFALITASIIVLPMYLADQIFGDEE